MRTSIAVLTLAAAFLAGSRPAEAQAPRRGLFGPRVFTGPGGPVTLTPGYGAPASRALYSSYSSGTVAPGAVVKPYSYYVLPASVPSRVYVGPAQFPFYGHPYGQPYDRWTWSYMGDTTSNVLNRYYHPPLGF